MREGQNIDEIGHNGADWFCQISPHRCNVLPLHVGRKTSKAAC